MFIILNFTLHYHDNLDLAVVHVHACKGYITVFFFSEWCFFATVVETLLTLSRSNGVF